MTHFTESVVETAALNWLGELGFLPKDGVVIGTSNRIAIPVTFTSKYPATSHGTTPGKHNFGGDQVVTSLRCDFSVTNIGVKEIVIIVMTRVRGQVFRGEISNSCCGS